LPPNAPHQPDNAEQTVGFLMKTRSGPPANSPKHELPLLTLRASHASAVFESKPDTSVLFAITPTEGVTVAGDWEGRFERKEPSCESKTVIS
jgi:hypothetical protein